MAKKNKQQASSGGGTPAWMVTYGDMMTLLLTFFVLILSFSSIQEAEFNKAIGALRGALGILGQQSYIVSLGKIFVTKETYGFVSHHSQQMAGDIGKKLSFISDYENASIIHDDRGFNIVLPANLLFDPGDDIIKNEAYPLLKKIGAFLYESKKKELLIEGYTDDKPIHTIRFPSNWHLSTARAISVARFLTDQCSIDGSRLAVCGYGEFKPMVPNNSEENRAKNRRVNVLIKGLTS